VRRLWAIVRREYVERVRSKAFVIGTFVGPLIMSGFMVVPGLLMQRQSGKPLRIAVVDASGSLGEAMKAALSRHKEGESGRFLVVDAGPGLAAEARERLRERVLDGSLDGYLYLPADIAHSASAEYSGKNVSNLVDLGTLDHIVRETVVHERLAGAGFGAGRIEALLKPIDLKRTRISATGDREDRGASFVLSLIFMSVMYMSLMVWGAAVMNGVIEEKTSRVVEVVMSSVSPNRLFGGKLLGVGAAGLTQFLVWAVVASVISFFGGRLAAASGMPMPEIPLHVLLFFVVYFLLGYFLYASLFACVGASVSSHQEAQSLVFPVMIPIISGFMLSFAVLGSPDSALSTTLSLIPFWTPLLMFLRISALTPPTWQIVLSIVLTGATIIAMNWAASRIYRVGILMYGKRPTFPEILKWVRMS
jgi:ABC-2 type transport system permease protein